MLRRCCLYAEFSSWIKSLNYILLLVPTWVSIITGDSFFGNIIRKCNFDNLRKNMGYSSPLTFARRSTKETSSPFLIWLVFAFWQNVLLKNFSDWTSRALFSWGDESISDNYLWKIFCLTYSMTFFKTVNLEQVITSRLYDQISVSSLETPCISENVIIY